MRGGDRVENTPVRAKNGTEEISQTHRLRRRARDANGERDARKRRDVFNSKGGGTNVTEEPTEKGTHEKVESVSRRGTPVSTFRGQISTV